MENRISELETVPLTSKLKSVDSPFIMIMITMFSCINKYISLVLKQLWMIRFVAEVRRAEEELAEFGVTSTIIEGKELK